MLLGQHMQRMCILQEAKLLRLNVRLCLPTSPHAPCVTHHAHHRAHTPRMSTHEML